MATLTAANAKFSLTIATLFPAPQWLAGYAADDVFTTDVVAPVETLMGVDGILSGGWTAVPKVQHISLQADSDSNLIFEQWMNKMNQLRETLIATGNVQIAAINQVYILNQGFLTGYPPMADARKILQPRRYQITWGEVIGNPMSPPVA
jgi:hypothetical protein